MLSCALIKINGATLSALRTNNFLTSFVFRALARQGGRPNGPSLSIINVNCYKLGFGGLGEKELSEHFYSVNVTHLLF